MPLTTGNFPLGVPQPNQISFGVANGCHMETRAREGCNEQEAPSKSSRNSSTGCKGSAEGRRRDMSQGTVMVLANGMYSKLCEELENDGALPFGYFFMAYLDIGGEHRHPLQFDPRVWILLFKKIL